MSPFFTPVFNYFFFENKSFAYSAVNSKRTLTWAFKGFLTRLFGGWMFTSHGERLDDALL